jgi:predicted acetyltransferase
MVGHTLLISRSGKAGNTIVFISATFREMAETGAIFSGNSGFKQCFYRKYGLLAKNGSDFSRILQSLKQFPRPKGFRAGKRD